MTSENSSRLRYRRWWWLLGVAQVLIVVYLSLSNISLPQLSSDFGDKINHLLAYGVLMGWFGQLLAGWRKRVLCALALIALGISMEFLQGMTPYRFFEWQDAIANCLEVGFGLTALSMGADKILHWFESLF